MTAKYQELLTNKEKFHSFKTFVPSKTDKQWAVVQRCLIMNENRRVEEDELKHELNTP